MKTILVLIAFIFFSNLAYAEDQWVIGEIVKLQEYGGYGNAGYHVMIELKNQYWPYSGDGSNVCTDKFRIKDGAEGVTNDIKNRMLSMLLASYMSGKKVALFVNSNTAPICNVIVVGIGNEEDLP